MAPYAASMLGLHLRLDAADVSRLTDNEEDLADILEEFEEDEQLFDRACQTDRAWEPIHNALAPDGEDDEWPARGVIGGARTAGLLILALVIGLSGFVLTALNRTGHRP